MAYDLNKAARIKHPYKTMRSVETKVRLSVKDDVDYLLIVPGNKSMYAIKNVNDKLEYLEIRASYMSWLTEEEVQDLITFLNTGVTPSSPEEEDDEEDD